VHVSAKGEVQVETGIARKKRRKGETGKKETTILTEPKIRENEGHDFCKHAQVSYGLVVGEDRSPVSQAKKRGEGRQQKRVDSWRKKAHTNTMQNHGGKKETGRLMGRRNGITS